MEREIAQIVARLGFPIALTLFFFLWFFGKYLPAQNEATERRFQELKEAHEQSLQAQIQFADRQRTLFEDSLKRIMEAVARLEMAIQGLQQRIEGIDRYRPPPAG